MKRHLAAIFFCSGLLLYCHGRANATTEFCPAILDTAPVAPGPAGSQTYGIQLRALSDRQVIARVAFDTSAGWFQADIPQTSLTGSVRTVPLKYPVDVAVSASPIMYVRFPSAVRVDRAFVTSALSYGDLFHWTDRGKVTCTPSSEGWPDPHYSLADTSGLSTRPAASATVVTPVARGPLESASCAEPFVLPRVLKQSQPAYPDAAKAVGASGSAIIGVAIDPDNSVADAWVQGSSDDATLDAAAVAAAQASTFAAGRVYCQAVPSIFYIETTFQAR